MKMVFSNACKDKGYRYVLLIVCTLVFTIAVGGLKSFGILYVELLDYYGTGSGETAWISSLTFFLICVEGPLANYLVEVYTFRKVMFIGGFMSFLGLMLCAFVPRMEYWYLTYGIVSGTGLGLVITTTTAIINFYFQKRRALALGIVVSGSGIGAFILPYIFTYLIETYSIKGAVLIISTINFNICVGTMLMRQPVELLPRKKVKELDGIISIEDHGQKRRSILNLSLLRNKSFAMFVPAVTLLVFSYVTNFSNIAGYAKQINLSNNQIAVVVSLFGGSEIIGRILLGFLADILRGKCQIIMAVCCIIGGSSCIIIPFFKVYEALIIHSIVVGLFTGSYATLMSPFILEVFPLQKLPAAVGLIHLFLAVPYMIGQPISGWIKDATGTWNMSFRLFGVVYFIAALICLLESCFIVKTNVSVHNKVLVHTITSVPVKETN